MAPAADGAPAAAAADAADARPRRRGALIVFEGLDRCGKTTQSARLLADLRARGHDAELWRFPERDPARAATGPLIDAYLKKKAAPDGGAAGGGPGDAAAQAAALAAAASMDDAAAHLLFSANRWERRPALLSALRAGVTVVADRYAHSGVAYSAAKRRPGMDRGWCAAPDSGLPAPDVVVFLDAGGGGALAARGGYGEERYEVPAFQAEVARQFDALLRPSTPGAAGGEGEGEGEVGGRVRCARVDARGTVDEVAAAVAAAVAPALEEARAGAPVRRLWDGEPLLTEEGEEQGGAAK
jgi:dTMP kinase